ncbi:MAG: hypothetical protein Q9166_008197 [cf. Caloplaca sp. 2 TL-2023]
MTTVEALRSAWSQALDIDEEVIEDASNFVELGGDSVTAIKLAEIAPSYGIALDAEAIFTEPTFNGMLAKTNQHKDQVLEGGNDPSANADTDLIKTCAQACGLSADQIEDIFCESTLTAHFFSTHQEDGAWLAQIVFELSSDLDVTTACRAFETIHARNHAFRSRFVFVDGKVQNVVTKMPVAWRHAVSLEDYKANDLATRVLPGLPAVRYGLVQEPEKTYIIWTALQSVQDAWTRKLLCDDLEAFLKDSDGYLARPSRPTYKKYVDYVKQMNPQISKAFWDHYLAGLDKQGLPAQALTEFQRPVMDKEILKHIPMQRPQNSAFRLSSMAHTAFGLALGSLTHCSDIAYFSIRGSRTMFPGAEATMGCVHSVVPVRVRNNPTDTVRELLSKVQDDSISMIRHEPFGVDAGVKRQVEHFKGITFNWYPRGMNLLSRDMRHTSKHRREGSMQVIEENFSPYQHPGVFAVHDNGDSLKVEAGYDDRFFSADFMESIAQRFTNLLHQMCSCDQTMRVQSLLDSVQTSDVSKSPGS